MESQIICPHCSDEYRDDNLPRLLIGCGHTFCETCLLGFIQSRDGLLFTRCPDDDTQHPIKERSVLRFPKNLALIKVIESKKECFVFKENEINVSKITKNSSMHEEEDTCELISIIENTSKKKLASNENSPSCVGRCHLQKNAQNGQKQVAKEETVCSVHKKPLDIVCTVDLQKICSNCAIFGEHKGHDFKSLEEVSQMHDGYVADITTIIKEKQKLQQQISCDETKNEIIGLLTAKRNKMREKMMGEFQKIEGRLLTKKKELLKKLDDVVKKEETNLKNCIKLDDELIKNYQDWFQKSDLQLKILEENDFEAKLILLFEGKNLDGDLVAEGQTIIQQMKNGQQKIFSEVEKKLEDLNICIKEDIYQYIDEFISITSEAKKPPVVVAKPEPIQQLPLCHKIMNNNKGRSSLTNSKVVTDIPDRKINMIPTYEPIQNVYLQQCEPVIQTHNFDESLLENDEQTSPNVVEFSLRMSLPSNFINSAPLSERFEVKPNIQPLIEKPESKIKNPPVEVPEVKTEKMTKKRLARMKLPERYEKIVENLLADSLDVLDLTNGEIGDSNMAVICENIANSKVRTLKLIRNKLTDEGLIKILPFCGQISVLNISQNLLTENILDILHDNKKNLGCLRTVILSQNKIVERKNKPKIDKLKKLEWNVTL